MVNIIKKITEMFCFQKETKDKKYFCCLNSYVSVLVLGVLQCFNIMVCFLWLVKTLYGQEPEPLRVISFVFLLATLIIGLMPYIPVLIWKDSVDARKLLFITQMVIYTIISIGTAIATIVCLIWLIV